MRSARGFQRWSGLLFALAWSWYTKTADAGRDPRLYDRGPPPRNLPFEPLTSPAECLPCKDIFSRLEETDDGGFVQRVEMAERG